MNNVELKETFTERTYPVVFHKETTQNGNVALYLAQDVKVKNNIGEGSAFSLAAFVGATASTRECLRSITVLPADHAIAQLEVGSPVKNAAIKLWRSTNPFKDTNSEENGYPSQAVLNPRTGKIATRDNEPVFEHRMVVLADPNASYEYDLSVPGEAGDTTSSDVSKMLQVTFEVPEERANKAAQIDFELEEKMTV